MIFYCHHANGDLFEAKALIEGWKKSGSFKDPAQIAHRQSRRLFLDQPWLEQIELEPWMDEQKPWVESPDRGLAVNLWVGRGYENLPGKSTDYIEEGNGIYIEGHFRLHNDIRASLGMLPLPGTADDYWPDIIDNPFPSNEWGYGAVLICNGEVRSGQAVNLDFNSPIISACNRFRSVAFYATTKTPELELAKPPNLGFTDDIFEEKSDLPEISILSRSCQLIVGRKSGPNVWAQSRMNLLNPHKTFLAFTTRPAAAWNVHPNNPKVRARRKWMKAESVGELGAGLMETLGEVFPDVA